MSQGNDTYSYELAKLIGKRLRETREALPWTRERVAASSGISAEFYEHLERGAALPSIQILLNLSASLGVTLDYLLGTCPEPPEHQELLAELTGLLQQAWSEDLAELAKHLEACMALLFRSDDDGDEPEPPTADG